MLLRIICRLPASRCPQSHAGCLYTPKKVRQSRGNDGLWAERREVRDRSRIERSKGMKRSMAAAVGSGSES